MPSCGGGNSVCVSSINSRTGRWTRLPYSVLAVLLVLCSCAWAQSDHSGLGKTYYRNRDFQRAIEHLSLALKQHPGDREIEQLLGLSYYAAGRLREAIPLLEDLQSVELDKLYLLGICYLKTEQPEKARATLARMFSVSPDSSAGHLMLAQTMVRQHLEEQALPEMRKAIALDARLPMAHFLLGEIYLYQLKPDLALEEFQRELTINPTVWLVYWRLGDAFFRLEKYEEAREGSQTSHLVERDLQRSLRTVGTNCAEEGRLGACARVSGARRQNGSEQLLCALFSGTGLPAIGKDRRRFTRVRVVPVSACPEGQCRFIEGSMKHVLLASALLWMPAAVGDQVAPGDVPLNLVTTADGYVLSTNNGYGKQYLQAYDETSRKVTGRMVLHSLWYGLAYDSNSGILFASSGANSVHAVCFGQEVSDRGRSLDSRIAT